MPWKEINRWRVGPCSRQCSSDAGAQRLDVARLIVILGDEAQLRQPAPAAQLRRHLVVDRAGGGAAVLREERQHENALRAGLAQPGQRLRHARLAVEHAELHRERRQHALRQRAGQLRAQPLARVAQRRAGLRPDRAVLARHPPRPQRQDEAMENRQPERPRHLHDARIGQHPRQKPAHGPRLRRVRRAGVDQQDADPLGGIAVEVGGADVAHVDGSLYPKHQAQGRARPPQVAESRAKTTLFVCDALGRAGARSQRFYDRPVHRYLSSV